MIWRREKPISSKGTAMAGGGGDVDSRLLGSERAGVNMNYYKGNHSKTWDECLNMDVRA